MLLRKISSSILSSPCSIIQFYNLKGSNLNSLYMKSLASFAIAKQDHINVELSNYIQSETTIKLLNKKGINNFFPIQAQTFHHITAGKDVIAGDKTGSGKTIAFALPVIQRMRINKQFQTQKGIKFVVLAPTRQLACQIGNEIISLKHSPFQYRVLTVYGGVPVSIHQRQLRRNTDILVATPGRALDLIQRKLLNFQNVKVICIDEADYMFDIGFQNDIDSIVSFIKQTTKKQCQLLCFSATLNDMVTSLTKKYMGNDKVLIKQSQNNNLQTPDTIKHFYIESSSENKVQTLKYLIQQKTTGGRIIIFTNTKKQAINISENLKEPNVALHGNVQQKHRLLRLQKFKNGQVQILVASDVAARGLDIPNVQLIINYDLPRDTQAYVHRSGRTGRAGKSGTCISIIQTRQNTFNLRKIKKSISLDIKKLIFSQNKQKTSKPKETSQFSQKMNKSSIKNQNQTQNQSNRQQQNTDNEVQYSQTKLILFDNKDKLNKKQIAQTLANNKINYKQLKQVISTKSYSKFYFLQAYNKQDALKILDLQFGNKRAKFVKSKISRPKIQTI